MIGEGILHRAVVANDQQLDTTAEAEVSPLPALLVELGFEPDAVFEAAKHRALRALAWTTNRDPRELTIEDREENKQFLAHQEAQFLDGFVLAARAVKVADE